MRRNIEEFTGQIQRLYHSTNLVKSITMQITEDCNLRCSYRYQINKTKNRMSLDTAKKFIDLLLEDKNEYINTKNTEGIILEFIGGEPLLESELITQITDYIIQQMIIKNHPWLLKFKISICSNGTLYFLSEIQKYLKKYKHWISLSISIDGNKELHDSCRVFPDGSGSYDKALQAIKAYSNDFSTLLSTKLTISPQNIQYLNMALQNLINIGFLDIYANCVYENVWSIKDAKIFYKQLKDISDFILNNNLEDTVFCSLFDENFFTPMKDEENENWCGGTGKMLAVNHKGDLYPCLRYMESSLGDDAEPIIIGNINHSIGYTDKEKKWINDLEKITRTSQSSKKCNRCKIVRGCAWCSAYNYQYYKKLNQRTTFICDMHKARALANYYFWNKYYKKHNLTDRKKVYIPKRWALKIISRKEFKMLLNLSK